MSRARASSTCRLSVYETTSDPSGIRIEQMHFLVELRSGAAQITEMLLLSLDGNRTFVGDANAALRFVLPKDAQALQIEGAEQASSRYEMTADGFVDKLALQPGQGVRQTSSTIRYRILGNKLDLNLRCPIPPAKSTR